MERITRYLIVWNGEQYMCYCNKYAKYSCYGVGDTPEEALKNLLDEIPFFEQLLKDIDEGKIKL